MLRPSVLTAAATAVLLSLQLWSAWWWPMTYDDLHLVRPYSASELRGVWSGPWDPDRLENAGWRPLTTWFNAGRYALCGESEVKHRLLLVALAAIFSGGLTAALGRLGIPPAIAGVGLLLAWCSRYSVYHYVWLTDGVHVLQGLAVVGMLVGLGARRALWGVGLSCMSAVVGLTIREDTAAGILSAGVLVLVMGDRPRRRGALAFLAFGTVVTGAMLRWRSHVVPEAWDPGWDWVGYGRAVGRCVLLGGDMVPSGWLGVLVLVGVSCTVVLAVAWLGTAARGNRVFVAVAMAVLAGATPALTLARANVLFFGVTFGGIAVACAVVDVWRSRARLMVVPAIMGMALSGIASGRAVASNFAPMSTTSLHWCGSFLYGPAHGRGATITPKRWRRTDRILGSVGIRSADDLPRLESLQAEALAADRRWPVGNQVFVPLLTPW